MTTHTLPHKTRRADFGRAVVVGGSLAGLTVARVLADYFAQVIIIERDRLPLTPEFRRSIPQARHAHLLLPTGRLILEHRFPGLTDSLLAAGATLINQEKEKVEVGDGAWFNDVSALICSRPLLEAALRTQLNEYDNIQMIQNYEVDGLVVNQAKSHVTGVQLRGHSRSILPQKKLTANLVVDTSGRGSQAAQWLADLGYTPPAQTIVRAYSGYTSRIYHRPDNPAQDWTMLRVKRIPPDQTRGGMVIPLEGNRWQVTLVGMAHDYPPHDEAGFLAFAKSLPSPLLYELITSAEPLSELYSYRGTQNQLRHFESLPRYLEGFLVSGDAACTLSPVHAQGMSAAALSSQTLGHTLAKQQQRDLTGLAQTFQKQQRHDIDKIWRYVTDSDKRWPATEVSEIAPARLTATIKLPFQTIVPQMA
jgi:2-polyprenyl-6-methoxyphenol hydroxylase-like FAD-dependent oxidoreductase